MTHKLQIEASDDLYERFWDLKEDEGDGGALDHADALEVLLDRYEGQRQVRPDTLPGTTQRIDYPRRGNKSGKCYVNINVDLDPEGGPYTPEEVLEADPFEVFIVVGDSGGVVNSWANALAKTLSNALRAGVDADVLADDLMGIRGPHTPAIDHGDDVYSVPDCVGIALKRHVEGDLTATVRGSLEAPLGVED